MSWRAFDAGGTGDDILTAIPTEVEHVGTGERRNRGAFVGDMVAVYVEGWAEPLANQIVGVQMPTQMIRITKQDVAVSGGEEVIESGTEVESAKTFVCRDPETDFVIVLKHVVIASRGFIGDTRSGVELRGFILNECPFQSERDIVPATVIETAPPGEDFSGEMVIRKHGSQVVGDKRILVPVGRGGRVDDDVLAGFGHDVLFAIASNGTGKGGCGGCDDGG